MTDQTPENKTVVTRFAPSPTGELHIGGARTALYSWAYAKRHHGKFLLRFEDTDQKRSSKQAEQNILRDLAWLGLHADNFQPGSDGSDIPRQSQRLDLYNTALEKLAAAGHTYEDPAGNGAIRFRMDKPISFTDTVYGDITVEADDLEDFIIKKADGFPTFHLAVVVDDADMNVTHVIRGQEHLSNTAKHAALYDALGQPRPTWCHTPSIMNPDGSKMSKRDKAKVARKSAKQLVETNPDLWESLLAQLPLDHQTTITSFLAGEHDDMVCAQAISNTLGIALPEINVADFQNAGYLPPVLLNYTALLGWNPGNDVERFDLNYLTEHFGFDRIGKSNSKFDREKLAAFSQDTILDMPDAEWAEKLQAHFAAHHPEFIEKLSDAPENFPIFAAAYKERSKTLSDPATLGRLFIEAPTTWDANAKPIKKNLTKNEGEGLKALAVVGETLAAIDDWSAEPIHASLDALWQKLELKNMGSVAQPLRVALAGNPVTPEIGPTLQLLGNTQTLDRIQRCLDFFATP